MAPSLAHADALPDAKNLFSQARERRLAGDCAGALPLFRQAYAMYPAGLGSLRNIAECEETVGHFASARRAWLDLQHAVLTSHEAKYEGWNQDAAQAAERLTSKLATLTIGVSAVTAGGQAAPDRRIDVSINGEPLSASLVGTRLERDPGQYTVRAESPDETAPVEHVVYLVGGKATRAELRVVVQPSANRSTAAADRHPATPPAAAWVATGLGLVSLAGAGVAAILRQSALNDLTRECGGHTAPCNPAAGNSQAEQARLKEIEDRGHADATWANVLAVVGIVGISSGAVLYVVNRPHSSSAAFVVSPGGVAAFGRF